MNNFEKPVDYVENSKFWLDSIKKKIEDCESGKKEFSNDEDHDLLRYRDHLIHNFHRANITYTDLGSSQEEYNELEKRWTALGMKLANEEKKSV